MRIIDIIIKKRERMALNQAEFDFVAKGAADGSIADYQLSAFLMACFLNPLSDAEAAMFTKAMAFSGKKLSFPEIKKPKVDKHSTGGVGDGISLALAPLVACADLAVPMMSGRGLGHTGGTLDKLEAMKGFQVRIAPEKIKKQMKALGVCMFGQTSDLAPADKKLYALRDATGTVESRPLIVASILSKKYAEGVDALVMDVKFGSGAFMREYADSKKLAQSLVRTASIMGLKCTALLTNMDQPLGRAAGNANEMLQSIKILKGDKDIAPDFYELLIETGAHMLVMGKKAKTVADARAKLEKYIASGEALEKLRQMIKWQGGDPKLVDSPETHLKDARKMLEFKADKAGCISRMDARITGEACVLLGAGRSRMEDSIDFGAGMWFARKVGDPVKKGDVIARLYASDAKRLNDGALRFSQAVTIQKGKVAKPCIIREIIK